MPKGVEYPTADEIHAMHERIVGHNDSTEPGIRTAAAVESALTYISEGYFGERPETIHEKAAHLMRLVTADHPYVDANKRTALTATAYL
jgi:death-on-curing protein